MFETKPDLLCSACFIQFLCRWMTKMTWFFLGRHFSDDPRVTRLLSDTLWCMSVPGTKDFEHWRNKSLTTNMQRVHGRGKSDGRCVSQLVGEWTVRRAKSELLNSCQTESTTFPHTFINKYTLDWRGTWWLVDNSKWVMRIWKKDYWDGKKWKRSVLKYERGKGMGEEWKKEGVGRKLVARIYTDLSL